MEEESHGSAPPWDCTCEGRESGTPGWARCGNQRFERTPELRVEARSDHRYEDVDDVVATVVLERRSRVIGVRPLCKALRGRADLLIDGGRFAVQSNAGESPAG